MVCDSASKAGANRQETRPGSATLANHPRREADQDRGRPPARNQPSPEYDARAVKGEAAQAGAEGDPLRPWWRALSKTLCWRPARSWSAVAVRGRALLGAFARPRTAISAIHTG